MRVSGLSVASLALVCSLLLPLGVVSSSSCTPSSSTRSPSRDRSSSCPAEWEGGRQHGRVGSPCLLRGHSPRARGLEGPVPATGLRGGAAGKGQVKAAGKGQVKAPSGQDKVLLGATVRTAVHAVMMGAFIEGSFALVRRASLDKEWDTLSRLVVWGIAVLLSGFFIVQPERWASNLQIVSLEQPLDKDWYASLKHPSWHPPYWTFPMAWIPLKILQVFALDRITDVEGIEPGMVLSSKAIGSYIVYKCLGDTWNRVMFSNKALNSAGAVMVAYLASLVVTLCFFWGSDQSAFYLLAPTALWVTLATSLHLKMVAMNSSS